MRTRLWKGCLFDFARWNAFFQKISISPEGTFVSTNQPVVVVIAHHPWNFHDFSTWLGNPWKEYFCQKSWCTILLCHLPPLVYCRLLDPSSHQNFLCPSLACMDIFWNYTILEIVSKPRASPILWMFRFSYISFIVKDGDCRVVTKLIFCLIFPPVITMFWVFLVVV